MAVATHDPLAGKTTQRLAPPSSAPYIEFESAAKSFGNNLVLGGVSFSVLPAETVCIVEIDLIVKA